MMYLSSTRRRVALLLVLFATVAVGITALKARANAAGPYGADTCLYGYVWREARSSDHVCVAPATRDQTARDNAAAASRRQPGGGASGPDTCKQGYVWREAFANDHVCVTPATRSQAAADNKAGPSRRALTTYSVSQNVQDGGRVHGTVHLDLNPNGAYSFRGHLRNDATGVGYTVSTVCVVKLLDGSALSFADRGNIKGDIETVFGGNKSRDWDKSGTSGQLANNWAKIAPGTRPACDTDASLNIGALIDLVKKAVGVVTTVVSIVG